MICVQMQISQSIASLTSATTSSTSDGNRFLKKAFTESPFLVFWRHDQTETDTSCVFCPLMAVLFCNITSEVFNPFSSTFGVLSDRRSPRSRTDNKISAEELTDKNVKKKNPQGFVLSQISSLTLPNGSCQVAIRSSKCVHCYVRRCGQKTWVERETCISHSSQTDGMTVIKKKNHSFEQIYLRGGGYSKHFCTHKNIPPSTSGMLEKRVRENFMIPHNGRGHYAPLCKNRWLAS